LLWLFVDVDVAVTGVVGAVVAVPAVVDPPSAHVHNSCTLNIHIFNNNNNNCYNSYTDDIVIANNNDISWMETTTTTNQYNNT
jgi:hypothetical protein